MPGPITITDGGYCEKDSDEALVYVFDFDTLNLAPGVEISPPPSLLLTPNDSTLTSDNLGLIAGNRKLQVRLSAGTIGQRYTVAVRVTTNEAPSQTKEKRFYLRIKS